MRLLRTLALMRLGVYGGLFAAAALLERALRSRGDAEANGVVAS